MTLFWICRNRLRTRYKGRAIPKTSGHAHRRSERRAGGTMPRIQFCTQIKMRKYLCTLYLLSVLFVALSSTNAKAEDLIIEDDQDPDAPITDVTLVWDQNPEQDIAGYIVYYGRFSGDYVGSVTSTDTTVVIGVAGIGTVYFAVTAFNTNGDESDYSEEVHWP